SASPQFASWPSMNSIVRNPPTSPLPVSWNWGEDIRGDLRQYVEAGSGEVGGFRTIEFMLGQEANWGLAELYRFGIIPLSVDFPNQPTIVTIRTIELLKMRPASLLEKAGWSAQDPRIDFVNDTRIVFPAAAGRSWVSRELTPDDGTWLEGTTAVSPMFGTVDSAGSFVVEVLTDGEVDGRLEAEPMFVRRGQGVVTQRLRHSLGAWAGEKIRLRFLIEPFKSRPPISGGIWIEPRLAHCGEAMPKGRPRRVVLVTLDTTRPDYLQPYGSEWVKTPFLQSLADTGTLFETCYATANSTSPSHASILTSLHVQDHKLISNGGRISAQASTIAEKFREAGYRTLAAVSVSHLAHSISGLAKGFDHFIFPHLGMAEPSAEQTNQAVFDLLDGDLADQPLFVWLHYFDPHAPYEPLGEYDRMYYEGDPKDPSHPGLAGTGVPEDPASLDYWRWLDGIRDPEFVVKQYGAEITYTDEQLRKFVEKLREDDQDALIVVTADHGESLGEHGIFVEHYGLHDPVTRVPLIFNGAGVPENRRIGGVVSTTSIAPTILELCKIPKMDLERGVSLVPYFESRDEPSFEVILEHDNFSQRGFRRGSRKYLRHEVDLAGAHWNYRFEKGKEEVYDLEDDPGELNNLADTLDDIDALRRSYERQRASAFTKLQQSDGGITPELQKKLEAMGYLGTKGQVPPPKKDDEKKEEEDEGKERDGKGN
ncbi:MAG: sulfatase, partial [Planctomycetota bacterium]